MKIKNYLLIALIILVAAFLRFYHLGSLPPGLTWDEAAWGYNAYSIGIDGRDEFGRFLPYDYLESFGDYKPPMYAYLDVVPVKVFGLNEFATRFPSALLGVLTVLITYFLVKRIFLNSKKATSYALFSSSVLALSPWHILLSRAAFEANVATFFIVFGIWLFLKGIQDKKIFLVLSFTSFVLSFYTFNTARVVSPLIVLVLVLGFRKVLLKNKKYFFLACFVGLMLVLPIARYLVSPQAQLRFKEVNIFSDPETVITLNQEVKNDGNQLWSKIIHNRRTAYSVLYLNHYFDNLNLNFLFVKGDNNPKFSIQTVGQMYLFDLPFFLIGLIYLFRKRESNWWIIPLWLIVGIIPAATARETPHALRTEATLPTFQIIVAYGLVIFWSWTKKLRNLKLNKVLPLMVLILFIANFFYFLHSYLFHYSTSFSRDWQYGSKDSIEYAKENIDNYDQIRYTTLLGRPYIYFLFYFKTDPKIFREKAVIEKDIFGFVTVSGFGKFLFADNLHTPKKGNEKILYINDSRKVPKEAKILKNFYELDGNHIMTAYTL